MRDSTVNDTGTVVSYMCRLETIAGFKKLVALIYLSNS